MCKKVALIGCSATKKLFKGRAADVYQGALFRLSLQYCRQHFDRILILSAKYGLLELDDIINPYNETLYGKTKQQRIDWALIVEKQIEEKNLKNHARYYFCGHKYHEFLIVGKTPFSNFSGIGYILQWLKQETRTKGFFQ